MWTRDIYATIILEMQMLLLGMKGVFSANAFLIELFVSK